MIDLRLDFFDQRQHIAHPQDSLGHAVRIKGLERVIFFADADELHRLMGNLLDGKRRATPRVAIHLCQNHACDTDAPVKLFRGPNGILAGHRIGNEQYLDRMGLALDANKLVHQLVVNVQAAGCVDHQGIEAGLLGVLESFAYEC